MKKYEEMIENNVTPTLEIFSDLINMFAKKGDADQIKKLMLEMQINGVKATTHIYNMQIEMHINKGTIDSTFNSIVIYSLYRSDDA